MKKNILLSILFIIISYTSSLSQEDLTYKKPTKEILELANAPFPPIVSINSKGNFIVMFKRPRHKSIEELSVKELRLGGLRINPKTNISSRERFYNQISVLKVGNKAAEKVQNLPSKGSYSNFKWSPDENFMAFTNTTDTGVELWVLNISDSKAKKISSDNLNANLGRPYSWFPDSKNLIVKFLPKDKKALKNKSEDIPTGPTVTVNEGKKAQNRTYQDLLKDKSDEFNFEQLSRSELFKVSILGKTTHWKESAMYDDLIFSPDGNYVLIYTINKPFSYLVPYYRFPFVAVIYDKNGNLIKKVLEVPLIEDLPKGFMAVRKGKRDLSWRLDKPAVLYWTEALDNGDPSVEVEYRDKVIELEAPFSGKGKGILKTKNRFSGITWGNDKIAFAYDNWWPTRKLITYRFDPSDNKKEVEIFNERNSQDMYNDPGSFITKYNKFHKKILHIKGDEIYLNGKGYSPEGIRPFVDKINLKTGKKERLWLADGKTKLEEISKIIDIEKGIIITKIQSKNIYPNYYIRDIKTQTTLKQITFIKNPFKSIENVHKELIKYIRKDGVELSGVLYLPENYDFKKKEKLPLFMWAYPKEYKDKSSAGQVTASPHEFTSPWYASPVFWVTKGYAVLDKAAFPIIGEGNKEPNDSFIEQLVSNAEAAINALDKKGFIDKRRVAVGGHSYGAFMTANLLSHCDLFAAGIARSGAYNRTLTPFGFQYEERTYWDSPEIYYKMSPFMHADKMKYPLLLIHGEADNNSGTYPMQSIRYFNALKGLGATVRLVILPKESHSYRAKESILHLLWEQDQWLEKYVKNRK